MSQQKNEIVYLKDEEKQIIFIQYFSALVKMHLKYSACSYHEFIDPETKKINVSFSTPLFSTGMPALITKLVPAKCWNNVTCLHENINNFKVSIRLPFSNNFSKEREVKMTMFLAHEFAHYRYTVPTYYTLEKFLKKDDFKDNKKLKKRFKSFLNAVEDIRIETLYYKLISETLKNEQLDFLSLFPMSFVEFRTMIDKQGFLAFYEDNPQVYSEKLKYLLQEFYQHFLMQDKYWFLPKNKYVELFITQFPMFFTDEIREMFLNKFTSVNQMEIFFEKTLTIQKAIDFFVHEIREMLIQQKEAEKKAQERKSEIQEEEDFFEDDLEENEDEVSDDNGQPEPESRDSDDSEDGDADNQKPSDTTEQPEDGQETAPQNTGQEELEKSEEQNTQAEESEESGEALEQDSDSEENENTVNSNSESSENNDTEKTESDSEDSFSGNLDRQSDEDSEDDDESDVDPFNFFEGEDDEVNEDDFIGEANEELINAINVNSEDRYNKVKLPSADILNLSEQHLVETKVIHKTLKRYSKTRKVFEKLVTDRQYKPKITISKNLIMGDLDTDNLYKVGLATNDRNQVFENSRRSMARGINLLIFLDISGSMRNYLQQLTHLNIVLNKLGSKQSNISVKIVMFSNKKLITHNWDSSKSIFVSHKLINQYMDGTSTGQALNDEYIEFLKRKGDKYTFIISDGESDNEASQLYWLNKYNRISKILYLSFGYTNSKIKSMLKKQYVELPSTLLKNLDEILPKAINEQLRTK